MVRIPRDTNGDGRIASWTAANASKPHPVDYLPDVVPLRDVALMAPATFQPYYQKATTLTFERHLAPDPLDSHQTLQPQAGGDYATSVGPNDYYTAVWGPNDTNRPKMIRIIAHIDDPNGRLGVDQVYEYVITLP